MDLPFESGASLTDHPPELMQLQRELALQSWDDIHRDLPWIRDLTRARNRVERAVLADPLVADDYDQARRQYVVARRAEAVARHAAQAARVHDLTNLLGSALVRTKRFDLAALVKVPQRSEFEPGEAGLALVPPHWADFAPDETPVRRRLLDDQKHRELRLADAKDRFQRALRVHGDAEIARQSELVGAQRIHFDRGAASDAEAKVHNDGLDVFASVLDGGDPAAVAQVILRTLHELFHSDSRGWLQTATLNGMARQTGTARHDRGVCLVTAASASRPCVPHKASSTRATSWRRMSSLTWITVLTSWT